MPFAPRSPRPEDALAVGDDDDPRRRGRGQLRQHLRDAAAIVGADEEPARPLEDVAELLAGEADRRRVDDRHHLVRDGRSARERTAPRCGRAARSGRCTSRGRDGLRRKFSSTRPPVAPAYSTCGGSRPRSPSASRSASRECRALVERRIAQQRHAVWQPRRRPGGSVACEWVVHVRLLQGAFERWAADARGPRERVVGSS